MITVVEFDFAQKVERTIPPEQLRQSCAGGLFCWVDLNADADRSGAETVLRDLGVNARAIEEALGPDVDGRHDLYDDCLHTAVTAVSFKDGKMRPSHVDIVIGERSLAPLRRGPVEFTDQVRAHSRQDFLKFAKPPSFLLYEYWDYLIENYKRAMRDVEADVERVQGQIFS